MARLEKQLARVIAREAELNALILEHAQDYTRLAELSAELQQLHAQKDEFELEWLEVAEVLER
jgi:ATP-binding cassette subfamily F protein uup